MSEEKQNKLNWQRLLITTGFVLLAALVVGGTTWYVMDKSAKEVQTANEKSVAELQKEIDELHTIETQLTPDTITPKTTVTNSSLTLTPEQIFTEVSKKFNFNREQVVYFRIWGQDKVQYSLTSSAGAGTGALFAYKGSGAWIDVLGGQGVNDCSVYTAVLETYRPICTKGTDTTLYYADANRSSTNYPIATATHYIGE